MRTILVHPLCVVERFPRLHRTSVFVLRRMMWRDREGEFGAEGGVCEGGKICPRVSWGDGGVAVGFCARGRETFGGRGARDWRRRRRIQGKSTGTSTTRVRVEGRRIGGRIGWRARWWASRAGRSLGGAKEIQEGGWGGTQACGLEARELRDSRQSRGRNRGRD